MFLDMANTTIKTIIIRRYENEVLDPEIGEGMLKQRLINGLEEILSGISDGALLTRLKLEEKSFLDKPIDYHSITESARIKITQPTHTAKRIQNSFLKSGISNYGDLLRKFKSSKSTDLYTFLYNSQTNLGKVSVRILLDHLESIGFFNYLETLKYAKL